ncbi:phosphopantetheine-binding protein [Streptomyces lasalocidi]
MARAARGRRGGRTGGGAGRVDPCRGGRGAGFPGPGRAPSDRAFTELGFDSLTAVQLRNRLGAFTRVRLSPTAVLEHPTPTELAAHVHTALVEAGALPRAETGGAEDAEAARTCAGSPAAGVGASYRFSRLYHQVLREKGPLEAMGLRYLASYALPAFTEAERARHTVAPVRLARGSGTPLVYLPDYLTPRHRVPTAVADRFDGERDLFLLEHPGFGTSRRAVPDGMATLARTHADTVRSLPLGSAPVLVGYCAGGAVAHAVARRLAREGQPADRCDPDRLPRGTAAPRRPARAGAHVGGCRSAGRAGGPAGRRGADHRGRLRPRPGELAARAVTGPGAAAPRPPHRAHAADRPRRGLAAALAAPHDSADLPGDHYSALHRDADGTAAAIRAWLTDRPAA